MSGEEPECYHTGAIILSHGAPLDGYSVRSGVGISPRGPFVRLSTVAGGLRGNSRNVCSRGGLSAVSGIQSPLLTAWSVARGVLDEPSGMLAVSSWLLGHCGCFAGHHLRLDTSGAVAWTESVGCSRTRGSPLHLFNRLSDGARGQFLLGDSRPVPAQGLSADLALQGGAGR